MDGISPELEDNKINLNNDMNNISSQNANSQYNGQNLEEAQKNKQKKKLRVSNKLVILVLSIFLFGFFLFGFLMAQKIFIVPQESQPPENVVLEYWGIFEPSQVMQPLIDEYQNSNPNVQINYTQKNLGQDVSRYKGLLYSSITGQGAPDIFRVHSTWIPKILNSISYNNDSLTKQEFDERFFPVYRSQCTTTDKVVCVPLMYDGLVLLYNKFLFQNEGIEEPKSWYDLERTALQLTKRDENNGLIRAGVALGNVGNIRNNTDILGLMFSQLRIKIPDALDSQLSADTITFFTGFQSNARVWDGSMPDSNVAFAKGDVAMVFAKTQDIREILELNPTLDIGVIPVPQVPTKEGAFTKETWANLWVETVSANSSEAEQREAWKFLTWLSLPEQQRKKHELSKQYRILGELPTDKTMYDEYVSTPYTGPILAQSSEAVTLEIAGDSGNDEQIKVLRDLINNLYSERGGTDQKKLFEILTNAKAQYKAIK